MNYSNRDLWLLASLCNASYAHDARPAVEALEMRYISQIGNGGCEALIVQWGGYCVVVLQGTRVLESISLPEIWDDFDSGAVILPNPNGGQTLRVHSGFWLPLAALWPRIQGLTLEGLPLLVTGHSLGGARAHLTPALAPVAAVVSFGAPKSADDAFWAAYYPIEPPLRVVYERDFAPNWPYEPSWLTHPAAVAWLTGGKLIETQRRPGFSFNELDHRIDAAYMAAFTKLVAADTFGLDAAVAETLKRLAQPIEIIQAQVPASPEPAKHTLPNAAAWHEERDECAKVILRLVAANKALREIL